MGTRVPLDRQPDEPGWWVASDGKWYPPEAASNARNLMTAPQGQSGIATAVAGARTGEPEQQPEPSIIGSALSAIPRLGSAIPILGAATYALARVTLQVFYAHFGLTPADVGISYAETILPTVYFLGAFGIVLGIGFLISELVRPHRLIGSLVVAALFVAFAALSNASRNNTDTAGTAPGEWPAIVLVLALTMRLATAIAVRAFHLLTRVFDAGRNNRDHAARLAACVIALLGLVGALLGATAYAEWAARQVRNFDTTGEELADFPAFAIRERHVTVVAANGGNLPQGLAEQGTPQCNTFATEFGQAQGMIALYNPWTRATFRVPAGSVIIYTQPDSKSFAPCKQ